MADHQVPAALDDDLYEWKTATSKNGVSFEIGVRKGEDASEEKGGARAAVADNQLSTFGKKDFGVHVHWPVAQGDPYWIETSQEIKDKAGITRYYLYYMPDAAYSYILWITNTEHYYYYFEDEEGDSYPLDTWINRDHKLRFNSKKPTILFIRGS